MQQLSDDDRREILGEILMDELKVIREYLEELLPLKADVAILNKHMLVVKSDLTVIKALLKDHSRQLNEHEARITYLEAINSS